MEKIKIIELKLKKIAEKNKTKQNNNKQSAQLTVDLKKLGHQVYLSISH